MTSQRPGAVGQVAAVLALQADAAARGPGRRRAVVGLALLPGIAGAAVGAGLLLPRDGVHPAVVLMPTAWLLFAVSAVVAAVTGAGGRRLIPREQAVAFPLTPGADHLGALLLAPLNVAWFSQAVGLLTLTTWVVGASWRLVPATVTTLLWVGSCTVLAQAVGWLVELARLRRIGRWVWRAVASTVVAGTTWLGLEHGLTGVLDRSPVLRYVGAALGGFSDPARWSRTAAELVAASAIAWVVGVRLLQRLQRSPQLPQGRVETQRHQRRPDAATAWAAMRRTDRASVWRSVPLRRGLAVLALVPGGAAAAAGLDWPMIALLPGMVASGAGLLFGVNAFALDSSGAPWRASLPGSPRTMLFVRLASVAEVCLAGAGLAVLAASWRAGQPTLAELAAVCGAWLATTAQVVARCAEWSVQRPYAAELREARDQPAPPAAMAGYSARLAVVTTLTGLCFFYAGAQAESTVLAVSLATAVVLLSARRMLRVSSAWDDDATRSGVLLTVAGSRG